MQIIFNLIDADDSGEIDLEELVGFIKKTKPKDSIEEGDEEGDEAAVPDELQADHPPEHTAEMEEGAPPGSLLQLLSSSFEADVATKYRRMLTQNGFEEVADIALASSQYLLQVRRRLLDVKCRRWCRSSP